MQNLLRRFQYGQGWPLALCIWWILIVVNCLEHAPYCFSQCSCACAQVHGSAPDIAGQDVANPLAMVLSAAMMCRYGLDLPQVMSHSGRFSIISAPLCLYLCGLLYGESASVILALLKVQCLCTDCGAP